MVTQESCEFAGFLWHVMHQALNHQRCPLISNQLASRKDCVFRSPTVSFILYLTTTAFDRLREQDNGSRRMRVNKRCQQDLGQLYGVLQLNSTLT